MKLIIVALALVALAAADVSSPEVYSILRSDFNQVPEGGYNFGFETSNGIRQEETGEIKAVVDEENKSHNVVVVRGSYSYVDNDGKEQNINYYADETGFHPEGDSIPKAPVNS